MPLEKVQFLQQCYPLPFLLDRGLDSGVPAGWLSAGCHPPHPQPNTGGTWGQRPTFPLFSFYPLLFSVLFLFLFTSPAPSSLSFLLSLSFHLPSSTGPQASCVHALFLPSYFEASVQ